MTRLTTVPLRSVTVSAHGCCSWTESQTGAPADGAYGWVYRVCPPTPAEEDTWGSVKERFPQVDR